LSEALSQYLGWMAGRRMGNAQIWSDDNPVGTQTVQQMSAATPLGVELPLDAPTGARFAGWAMNPGNPLMAPVVQDIAGNALSFGPGAAKKIAPRPVADRMAKHLEQMGYSVGHEGSSLSGSRYLTLNHDAVPNGLKIRVSDHDLPPSYGRPGDYDVHSGSARAESVSWMDAVRDLAERIGAPVPPGVKSATTRQQNAAARAADQQAAARSAWDAQRAAQPKTAAQVQIDMLSQAFPELAERMKTNAPNANAARLEAARRYEQANPGTVEWVGSFDPRKWGMQ
jgi:hypothetical protein